MSINVSQIYVRYPDEKDAAEVLAGSPPGEAGAPVYTVIRTPSPWLAVASRDNTTDPAVAQRLSRALEAKSIWYGLAGNALAYRLIRYELGREVEQVRDPADLFREEPPSLLPEYRDVEQELHARLRREGIPTDYVFLFSEEIGASAKGSHDAAVVRGGAAEPFTHRVPRRESDEVRTLFDLYKEGEQRVTELLHLQGAYDEARARRLFATLETVCRRRALPEGWKVQYLAGSTRDPDLGRRLAELHAKGRFSYELAPPPQ
jgi:hypothetical protein